MSARHTPGPWTASPAEDVYFQDVNILREDGLAIACAVANGDISADEAQANGRLIAAAPELLEALKALMPDNVSLTNRNIRDKMILPMDVEIGALRRASSAIAKADGQS